jgi:hypothetical protein
VVKREREKEKARDLSFDGRKHVREYGIVKARCTSWLKRTQTQAEKDTDTEE